MIRSLLLILNLGFAVSGHAELSSLFATESIRNFCANSVKQLNETTWAKKQPHFVYHGEHLYAAYRQVLADSASFRLSRFSTDGEVEVFARDFSEPVVDLAIDNENAYLLFPTQVKIFRLADGELTSTFDTVEQATTLSQHHRAHAMILDGRSLVIAHGFLGVVVLKLDQPDKRQQFSMGITEQPAGHKSKAVAIAKMGNQYLVGIYHMTMPTGTSHGFNGVFALNTDLSGKFTRHPYNRRLSGILSYSHFHVSADTLYINNLGIFQFVHASQLVADQSIRIHYRPVLNVEDGETHNLELAGDLLFDQGMIHGCGHFTTFPAGQSYPRILGRAFSSTIQN